jgi:chromatin accessibility complex protein 1
MYLTKLSQRHGTDTEVEYKDLAAIVERKESMEFLHDIVPKKIKYEEYLKIMESKGEVDDDEF